MIIDDGIIYKSDIDIFIEKNSINRDRIKWGSLYEICEEGSEEESDWEDWNNNDD